MSTSTAFTLVVLTVIGAYTIHGLSVQNGLYEMINASKAQGFLPDNAKTAYTAKFTGFGPVDDFLATLLTFFWPAATGQGGAGLTLMSILFGGQSCAAITMVMIEGFRKGNEGKAVSL
jgi:hypothetical protein